MMSWHSYEIKILETVHVPKKENINYISESYIELKYPSRYPVDVNFSIDANDIYFDEIHHMPYF